jgi:hypothetical protein
VQGGSSPAVNGWRPFAFVIEYPIASLDGGTVLALPSMTIVSELFPSVISKRLA